MKESISDSQTSADKRTFLNPSITKVTKADLLKPAATSSGAGGIWKVICLQRARLDINCASSRLGRGVALCSDLEWFAIQHLGDHWTGARWFIDSAGRSGWLEHR